MRKLLSLEEASLWRESLRSEGKTLAFANGVFDLLHVGHVRYLQGARALADALIVAVNSDRSTRANKGDDRPLVPEAERLELIAALECVDAVLLFDAGTVDGLLQFLRPDVHVKGTDYTPETVPERATVLAYGGRVAIAGDPKDHSTTATVAKLNDRPPPPQRLPQSLTSLLACPGCRGALSPEDTGLACISCAVTYPVEGRVPVLLPVGRKPAGSG